MSTVADLLTDLVAQAAEAAGHADAPVSLEPAVPTNDPRFGDYQSNFAFRLGKSLRTNPRAVATAMVEQLPDHEAVAKVEVAGPGFINFTLSDAWLAADLHARASSDDFGAPRVGEGSTLVIDYSSPNIAKRMHVGHMRSTLIGNALHRLYAYLGYEVVADNHIGDWGTQFGKLIVAWHRWRDDAAYAADPIGELQRIYQRFGVEAKEDPELVDLARAETAKLQQGDEANHALWQQFVDVSLKEFDGVYERLGVCFDVTLGESFYHDALAPLVDDLLSRGLAERSEGAVVVPFTEDDGKGLSDKPLLIRKRDGAFLYGTTDLATVDHRVSTWDPAEIVYVTDVRQKLHFQQVFAASRKVGHDVSMRHVWFGMLRFADGAVAASRTGKTVNLVDVLDEAVRRARAVVDKRSAEIPDDERAAIAEVVGLGAVRYADLSQNPQSDIIFEWDKILSLQGNTAPYLMYAHARCWSILRKGGFEDLDLPPMILEAPEERALAMALVQLPEKALAAGTTARPNLLADHLFGLAQTFTAFYSACPVLKEEDDARRSSRLGLVMATARGLRLGLDLLGLGAPQRM